MHVIIVNVIIVTFERFLVIGSCDDIHVINFVSFWAGDTSVLVRLDSLSHSTVHLWQYKVRPGCVH